jgi:uncharacterized protein YjbK
VSSRASGKEIELKRMLVGERAADKLIAVLGEVSAEHQQINHVFDTDDRRLDQQKYAVRLRVEDGASILTAKGPGRIVGAHASSRTEAEARIEDDVAAEVLAGRLDPIEVLRSRVHGPAFEELWSGLGHARAGRALSEVGHFRNQRRVVRLTEPGGRALDVEIDRTSFPDGHVDDEVEIEVPDEADVPAVEAWLDDRLATAGVATAPSTPKIARFYAALPGGAP